MEMTERKYATECAKINYKTFTFSMRSWNSSKNPWPNREGLGRRGAGSWTEKTLSVPVCCFHAPIPIVLDRSRVDIASTNGSQKLWVQLKSHFFPSELYSQRSETPRDGGCAVTRLCLGAVAHTPQWNTHLVECLHSRTHLSSRLQMGTSTDLALGRQEGLRYKSSLG